MENRKSKANEKYHKEHSMSTLQQNGKARQDYKLYRPFYPIKKQPTPSTKINLPLISIDFQKTITRLFLAYFFIL